MEVFTGVGFKAQRFHGGKLVDGCEDCVWRVLELMVWRGRRMYLEAQRLGLRRFGGMWDHILVIFGLALKLLLPLTLRVEVRDIAGDAGQQRRWVFSGIPYR